MSTERAQIEATISGQETQRELLGNAVVDAALGPLRSKLAALDQVPSTAPQVLKQVTILFMDIVGSTALSQNLDPEAIRAVMDSALSRCTAVVDAHGGKVLRYAGDSLLAVFGADAAHEDDPERAVRAGLALLAEGRVLRSEVQAMHAHAGFNVRVGVHTGGVLLGSGIDAQSNIWGVAVNIAARMEQTAPPGALRISHDVYRHVRGVFNVEPQPPIDVKGVDEPMLTYLVQGAKPRAFRVATRGIEGVETRMIGRDGELEIIQDTFNSLYSDPRLQAITVVGEPGVGKSRLLYEFESWAEARTEGFYLFQGRSNPQAQSQPYGLLRDILAWRLQLSDTASMQVAKAGMESGIAPYFVDDDGANMAQAHAHLLGHLIGLDFADSPHVKGIADDARQIRNRGFHTAAQLFRRVSAQDGLPILLNLEDVQWADDGSLDFLNYLSEVNSDVPMLVLSLARPTLYERRPDWRQSDRSHRRIDLHPFGREHSRDLANELLKRLPTIPAAVRELVTGGAEGNPFYMEELVKMLVDQGAIVTGTDQWTLHPNKLLDTHVPPTLTGVLQARLDGLPPAERLALQQASVIGMTFWDDALAALDPAAPAALPSLVQRELVMPGEGAGPDGAREYSFKHQILHHVTYDTLLKGQRRTLHANTAAWFARISGSRAAEFLGDTAEHFAKAGDVRSAAEFHARAAEEAKQRFAHDAALRHADLALALLGETSNIDDLALRWRLWDVREQTLMWLSRRAEQASSIDALEQIAEALDDDRRRALVAFRRSRLAMRVVDTMSQKVAALRAMHLADKVQDHELKLDAARMLSDAAASLESPAAGMALAKRALEEARERGLRRTESLLLNSLEVITWALGDSVLSLELSQQSLAIDRETGDRRGQAVDLCNVADAQVALGDFVAAQATLAECLQLVRQTGYRALEGFVHTHISRLCGYLGKDTEALVHAREALQLTQQAQDKSDQSVAYLCVGIAELALGRHAEAASAFATGHAVAAAMGLPFQHDLLAGAALVALAAGSTSTALAHIAPVLAHLQAGGTLDGTRLRRVVLLTCYQVLARAADPRADDLLSQAHASLQQQVAVIVDPHARRAFLEGIPEHRDILAAWAKRQAPVTQG